MKTPPCFSKLRLTHTFVSFFLTAVDYLIWNYFKFLYNYAILWHILINLNKHPYLLHVYWPYSWLACFCLHFCVWILFSAFITSGLHLLTWMFCLHFCMDWLNFRSLNLKTSGKHKNILQKTNHGHLLIHNYKYNFKWKSICIPSVKIYVQYFLLFNDVGLLFIW